MSWSRNAPSARTARAGYVQLALFPRVLKATRVYHPYSAWEEYRYGMWRHVSASEHAEMLPRAIAFTGDAVVYGIAMRRIVQEWPISCEHNLTCVSMNRQAWIGHAAVAITLGIPEQVTRDAWHHLTQVQRDAANAVAADAVREWESRYANR